MKALVITLILWINQNSIFDHQLNGTLPQVKQVSADQLISAMLDNNVLKNISAADLDAVREDVAAIYHPGHNTIYLRENIDLSTDYGKSALVHELIHFIQYQNGQHHSVPCIAALEREAYKIQRIYMEQHGVAPDFDKFTVAMRSLCPYD